MAHSVNPKYYTSSWIEEVPGRVSPHNDAEITENRNKFFKKYFTNPDDMRRVKQQFADFSLCMNAFEDPEAIEDRAHFDPKQWWGTYGVHAPELKDLALMLLGQPSSSSCCERNWSTYSFIHSLKRNRLNPGRAEDLVFVHNNLRLLSRKSKDYENRPSRMWDVGGDGLDNFDGVGILEGADLALDEPEFEQEIVGDESI
uniref:Uncharacterized protein n=1 Tax=Avena sativa TaxID=4498 RepID=A0ACD5X6A5_AVESA